MPYDLPGDPIEFSPLGVYDAVDGTHVPKGACAMLTNLMHDITTPNTWVPRPANLLLTSFASFLQPNVVSAAVGIGSKVYGMIGTALTPGFDQPFCFDTSTLAFVAITGVTALNVPRTLATTGDWTPPTMAVIGSKIILTHTGFSGTGTNFLGVIDISVPAVPVWSSSNTGTNALVAVPTGVIQFNDRAWYIINNALVFSKSLDPLTVVNATDVLTLGDAGTPVVSLAQQTIQQTTGGIIQALIAFKTAQGFWQITGDASSTTSPLSLNGPNAGVGCGSARSTALTPAGVFFASLDGVRIVRLDGVVSDKPIPGIRQPFNSVVTPTRTVAAYNDTVYRVCLTWASPTLGQVQQDYWYDFEINQFSGPHTFPYDVAVPVGSGFVLASNTFPAKLFSSTVSASASDTYIEYQVNPSPGSSIWGAFTWGSGVWGGATISAQQMKFELTSSIFPQRDMQVQAVVESTIDLGFSTGTTGGFTIQMLDPAGGVRGLATVQAPSPGTVWGSFTWGASLWAGANLGFQTYNVDWSDPVVYKRAQVDVTGNSFLGFRIGSFRMRSEAQGYMNLQNPP